MLVPQMADHRFARIAAAAPRAIHLQPRLAALDDLVEAAVRFDLVLKLAEAVEAAKRREAGRERPHDSADGFNRVGKGVQRAGGGLNANGDGNGSDREQRAKFGFTMTSLNIR